MAVEVMALRKKTFMNKRFPNKNLSLPSVMGQWIFEAEANADVISDIKREEKLKYIYEPALFKEVPINMRCGEHRINRPMS